jgi:hypothetical protein
MNCFDMILGDIIRTAAFMVPHDFRINNFLLFSFIPLRTFDGILMKNEDPYSEAMRYIENANDSLKLAGGDGRYYDDKKYIKIACGTAYSAILVALDGLFDIKQVPRRRGRKAIEYYQENLAKIDKKLLSALNNAYTVLHLDGYYGGITSKKLIEEGFDEALFIINSLKPYSKNGEK